MQIRLRPSGGRGEYELAGSHGTIRVADLYGLQLWIDFGLELHLPLHATANIHDGKPRLRLDDQRADAHAARLVSAVLLLPEPVREIRKTGGAEKVDLQHCAYSAITVDVVNRTSSSATLRPKAIFAINASGASLGIDVLTRFEQVQRLWAIGSAAVTALDAAVCEHRAACIGHPLIHKQVLTAAGRVIELLGKSGPFEQSDWAIGADRIGFEVAPSVPAEDDTSNPIHANREIRKRLAWRAERGFEGRRFKQMVNDAYGFRCAFTGLRLPSLQNGYSPGVDAAHIYPWSRFGSNEVTNGICLSRQMHWAFDEGILKLSVNGETPGYAVALGDGVARLATNSGFDLNPFASVCGPISEAHLPQNPSMRPSIKAIELYNALMFPSV